MQIHMSQYAVSFRRLCARVFVYFLTPIPCLCRNMGDIWWTDNRWGESRWIFYSSISQSIKKGALHMMGSILDLLRSLFLHKNILAKQSTATKVIEKNEQSLILYCLCTEGSLAVPHPSSSLFLPPWLSTDGGAADDSGLWKWHQSVWHSRGLCCGKVSIYRSVGRMAK